MKNKIVSENRYSRRKKVLMWFVFIGIFVCGMMAGAFMWQNKNMRAANSNVNNENEPVDSCVLLRDILLERISDDNGSWNPVEVHENNAKIYDRIVAVGCEQDAAVYKEKAALERRIAENLRIVDENVDDESPCMVIEKTLLRRVNPNCSNSWCYLDNAEIYSKMAEDGCPGNKDINKRKALDELQIAEGVRVNDEDIEQGEIRSAINTYKKLQMQNEAKKYLNKVEKMINPGIDFILELQKIIEE